MELYATFLLKKQNCASALPCYFAVPFLSSALPGYFAVLFCSFLCSSLLCLCFLLLRCCAVHLVWPKTFALRPSRPTSTWQRSVAGDAAGGLGSLTVKVDHLASCSSGGDTDESVPDSQVGWRNHTHTVRHRARHGVPPLWGDKAEMAPPRHWIATVGIPQSLYKDPATAWSCSVWSRTRWRRPLAKHLAGYWWCRVDQAW